eukprot:1112760-Amorphochlora_amoeboformis.AAC.1
MHHGRPNFRPWYCNSMGTTTTRVLHVSYCCVTRGCLGCVLYVHCVRCHALPHPLEALLLPGTIRYHWYYQFDNLQESLESPAISRYL